MNILQERIKVYGKVGDVLNSIEGVSLEKYRLGVSNSVSTYTTFHDYSIKVDERKGGFFSFGKVKPVKSIQEIDSIVREETGLAGSSVVDEIQTLTMGRGSEDVFVREANYQFFLDEKFSFEGEIKNRLCEWIKIRTVDSFPTLSSSFYGFFPDEVPVELEAVWGRLKRR